MGLCIRMKDVFMFIVLSVVASFQVVHGADKNILWLQRDFSLYVVNMFDTHQASYMLQFPKNLLAFLLKFGDKSC